MRMVNKGSGFGFISCRAQVYLRPGCRRGYPLQLHGIRTCQQCNCQGVLKLGQMLGSTEAANLGFTCVELNAASQLKSCLIVFVASLSCWQVLWQQGVRQRCLRGSEQVLALGCTQKGDAVCSGSGRSCSARPDYRPAVIVKETKCRSQSCRITG